jgi:hypothetical protein
MTTHELQLSLHLPLPYAVARQTGHEGAERARAKAEEACPDFSARAYAFLADYAHQQGTRGTFSGESCTDAMKMAGIVPHDDRAFGSIYARAIRQGLIRVVGYCARTKGHGTAGGRVYARGGV